jgi:hypothetical protein
MKFPKAALALTFLISGTPAQQARVSELLSKDLTNLSDKEGLLITVEYPPGTQQLNHNGRHFKDR